MGAYNGGRRSRARLARILDGDVVAPGAARYASARLLWDTRFDRLKPRAIAYCASSADVEKIVRWARTERIHLVPRSGGHSYAGYSSGNGVVVADVSRLHQREGLGLARERRCRGESHPRVRDRCRSTASRFPAAPARPSGSPALRSAAVSATRRAASGRRQTTSRGSRSSPLTANCSSATQRTTRISSGPAAAAAAATSASSPSFTFTTHPVSTVSTYSIEWPWAQAASALDAWQQFAPHAPDALFSVLDLIATDPSVAGARAHVVSAGQYFGPESDLASLLQPLTSAGAPIRVTRRRSATSMRCCTGRAAATPRAAPKLGRRSQRSPTTSTRRSRQPQSRRSSGPSRRGRATVEERSTSTRTGGAINRVPQGRDRVRAP